MAIQRSNIEERERRSMSRKGIAQGIVALMIGMHGWGFGTADAEAASPFSLVGIPQTVMPGASFTLQLNADFGEDLLISLDPTVGFDSTRLSFGGYEIVGTLTDGFFVFESLQDTTVSLLQSGELSPVSPTAVRARFNVLPQAPQGVAAISLHGFAGLESLDAEIPFDFGSTLTVAAVPEPAAWLTLGIGFCVVGLMRRRRSASTHPVAQAA
jgi:hypothetical protein